MASQLIYHLICNGLDNVNQSAYKLGHPTETALLLITNEVHLVLARGEATAGVLLDQSSVFDTIGHSMPVDTLNS